MTGCAHRLEPPVAQPFQIVQGAAWLMDFCAKCGERHWYVRTPFASHALTEEQPLP